MGENSQSTFNQNKGDKVKSMGSTEDISVTRGGMHSANRPTGIEANSGMGKPSSVQESRTEGKSVDDISWSNDSSSVEVAANGREGDSPSLKLIDFTNGTSVKHNEENKGEQSGSISKLCSDTIMASPM